MFYHSFLFSFFPLFPSFFHEVLLQILPCFSIWTKISQIYIPDQGSMMTVAPLKVPNQFYSHKSHCHNILAIVEVKTWRHSEPKKGQEILLLSYLNPLLIREIVFLLRFHRQENFMIVFNESITQPGSSLLPRFKHKKVVKKKEIKMSW